MLRLPLDVIRAYGCYDKTKLKQSGDLAAMFITSHFVHACLSTVLAEQRVFVWAWARINGTVFYRG